MKRLFWLLAAVVLIASIVPATSVHAATLGKSLIKCSAARASGTVDVPAPFVRAKIYSASNLMVPIAETIVAVAPNGNYRLTMKYPSQPKGTRLILTVGEWDGAQYLQPATMVGQDCVGH